MDEVKKVVESYKKQLAKAEKEHEEALKAKDGELAQQNENFKVQLINKEFKRFVNDNYELADAYKNPVVKDGIVSAVYKEATKKAKLALDDDANISLRNIENDELPFYINGSKEGTLKDLVDPAIKDFLKKSDSKEKKPMNYPSNPVNIDTNIPPMIADRYRKAQEIAENGTL